MTTISKRTIATALSAIVLSTGIATTFNVSSAEAGMRGNGHERIYRGGNRGYPGHGGNFNGNMAIGMGVIGAMAIIGAMQARPAVPQHVTRRCAQYAEWRDLHDNAKKNARIQLGRGDQRGANSWLRSARRYAAKADAARRDCKRWTADYR